MICRNKNSRSHGAYTFLEIAMALGIIAILFATMFPVVSASMQEKRLRNAMDAISQTVRERRQQAEVKGLEENLILTSGGLATRGKKDLETVVGIPQGMALQVKYPRGEWEAAKEQPWRIFALGAVQPLSLRLQQGSTWIEADFDFLTGGVAAERYSF